MPLAGATREPPREGLRTEASWSLDVSRLRLPTHPWDVDVGLMPECAHVRPRLPYDRAAEKEET